MSGGSMAGIADSRKTPFGLNGRNLAKPLHFQQFTGQLSAVILARQMHLSPAY